MGCTAPIKCHKTEALGEKGAPISRIILPTHGFQWELGLLGILRVSYRGYDQLIVGIKDLNGNQLGLLGILKVLYRGCDQLVILRGIRDISGNWNCWELQKCYINVTQGFECELRLLGILRVLYRVYDQLVILVGIRDLNGNSIRSIANSKSAI